jgi:hypothetical protein
MKKTIAFVLFSLTLGVSAAIAQVSPADRCADSETIGQCFKRLHPSTLTPPPERVKSTTDLATKQQMVAVANEVAGLPNVSGPGTPALIDFLNLFAGSVSDSTFNQSDSQYTFEWNVPVNLFGDGDKLKIQSVFDRKPQLDQT